MTPFASEADYEVCRQLHKEFGTTYYYSTRRFPADVRLRVHAIYGFVRIADEWVDNPGELTPEEQRALLRGWRESLLQGVEGNRPEHPAMRAFVDTVQACKVPVHEAELFLDAMEADIDTSRYERFEDLQHYMRGSASAVGIMVCAAMGVALDEDMKSRAMALGDAMQLTNFIRDIGEDMSRGRIYLPQEDLKRFGVTENDLYAGEVTQPIRDLLAFEIERARRHFSYSDPGTQQLPKQMREAVLLARLLYARILDRVEEAGFDVFSKRARTSAVEKAVCAASVLSIGDRIIADLAAVAPPDPHGDRVKAS